jgi:hypothetical protein
MAKRDENAFLLEEKKYQNIVRKREAKEREGKRREKEEEEMKKKVEKEEGEKEGEKGERKDEMLDSESIEKSKEKSIEKANCNKTQDLKDRENNGISDEEVVVEVEEEVEKEVESEIEAWGSVEILPCDEKDYLRKTGNTDSIILKHGNSFTEYSYPEIDLIDEIPNTQFNNTSYKTKYNKDSNKDEILNDDDNDKNDYDNNNSNNNNDNKSNSGKFNFLVNTSNKFRSKNISEKSNKTNSGRYRSKIDKKNYTETVNRENTENENVNINEYSRRRSMSESYFMENQSKQALVPLHLKTFSYMHTHLLGEI